MSNVGSEAPTAFPEINVIDGIVMALYIEQVQPQIRTALIPRMFSGAIQIWAFSYF